MPPEDDLETLALRFALQNALEHEGTANQGAVIGRLMALDPSLRARAQEVAAAAAAAVERVDQMSAEERERELARRGAPQLEAKDTRREGLPDLPGAERGDRITMRFAPNPNGPPTLGHSRGMCINGWYAKEYDGDLILRFDDTDPVNKPPWEPAYGMFEEGFTWLGIPIKRVLQASDRLDTYYEYAAKALALGAAYVCTCEAEAFRELKNQGEVCPHRGDPVEEQLERWEAMREASYAAGEAVVRIKTDITHKDPALRDWVALRIVDVDEHPHARTGSRYHIWPMLDFESAIEDHLLGVTHIIRGKDLADSERKQRFLYDHFGWEYPEVLHWGRVAVHGFGKFSTSQLRRDIEAGEYSGWDDPQLPTLAALARRGFLPEALMQFWVDLGLTEKDIEASMETLEAENRKRLDPRADRLFFVRDPVTFAVEGLDEPHTATLARHPDHPGRGTRTLTVQDEVLVPRKDTDALEEGTVFRLKDGLDLRVTGRQVASFHAIKPSKDRDGPIVQWCVPGAVACTVLMPDGTEETGVVEREALGYEVDDVVQFERFGFVRFEQVAETGVRAVYTHG